MGIPYVYLDSWHLEFPMPSSRCVMVPSLVIEKHTKRTLCFVDQFNLYHHLQDCGDEIFPFQDYDARNAAPEDILDAVKEALDLDERTVALSKLQCQYRDHFAVDGLMVLTKARVSQKFLEKHFDLFSNDWPRIARFNQYV